MVLDAEVFDFGKISEAVCVNCKLLGRISQISDLAPGRFGWRSQLLLSLALVGLLQASSQLHELRRVKCIIYKILHNILSSIRSSIHTILPLYGTEGIIRPSSKPSTSSCNI